MAVTRRLQALSLMPLHGLAEGRNQSIPSLLHEVTGLSKARISKGNLDAIRPSTQAKVDRHLEELLQEQFKGQREYLLFQLVQLVEQFIASNKIEIPSLFHQDPLRKRILFSLHIDQITQHLMQYVVEQNTLRLEPVFDGERPIGSTRDMRTWYTTRIAEPTQHSQISHIVVDSGWEKYAANVVEAHPKVAAWAKNDHLGFSILYLWNGSKRKYIPDFLVRYQSGKTLVLEIKGQDSPQDQAKRAALDQWVKAVNAHGGFGTWAWDVVVGDAAGMRDVVDSHASKQ